MIIGDKVKVVGAKKDLEEWEILECEGKTGVIERRLAKNQDGQIFLVRFNGYTLGIPTSLLSVVLKK